MIEKQSLNPRLPVCPGRLFAQLRSGRAPDTRRSAHIILCFIPCPSLILSPVLTPPPQSGLQLTVRLEELRLLESRKSSRLSGQANTDFSKLADFNIVHERKRLNSEKSSDGSEFFG